MTTQDYTDTAGSDFTAIDDRFSTLLAELEWLAEEDASLVRMGLRELRRNVRTYTFGGADRDLDISLTASPGGVTVIVEHSGPAVGVPNRDGHPDPAGIGDHRLRVLDRAYDQVTYSRDLDRNRWILRRFAPSLLAAAGIARAA